MQKSVTIYDIAKIANASVATVSRVLSNSNYPVSSEMSKKIKAVAKEMNYTPNMFGKQLKTNNSMTIGVIIPSISNPFYADVVSGIEEIARNNGYHVLLCNSHQNPKLEAEYLQTLLEHQVKGLILSSISKDMEILSSYLKKGLNVISIDQMIDSPEVYQIGFDYRKGGYLACKHLIEQGHRKIAFVTAQLDRPSRFGLFHGYQDALRESGITPLDLWFQESRTSVEETYGSAYEFTNGKQLVRNLLNLSERPTAIMTCNDLTAFGVVNELNEQGIDVPGEMSVIGFDNIEFSQMVTPALTTVDVPKYELGRFSCKMLLDIMNGTTIDVKEIVLQPKLIVRQSVTSPG